MRLSSEKVTEHHITQDGNVTTYFCNATTVVVATSTLDGPKASLYRQSSADV